MGMSQNPVPAEGFVSVVSFDQLGSHQQLQASHNQQHVAYQQIQQVEQHQQQQHQQTQMQQHQQTQILVLGNPAIGPLALTDENKGSSVLLVTEMPQAQNLVLPATNIIQLPMTGIQQTDTLELVGAGNNLNVLQVPSTALSIVPNTLFVANNNVYMCLPPDETITYQIAYETAPAIPEQVAQPVADFVQETYKQVIEATSWHLDSDIANRALAALAQIPEFASTNQSAPTFDFTTTSTSGS